MYNPRRTQRCYSLYMNGKLRSTISRRNKESLEVIRKEIHKHLYDLIEGGVVLVNTFEKTTKSKEYVKMMNEIFSILYTDKDKNTTIYQEPFMLEYTGRGRFIFALKDEYIDEEVIQKISNPLQYELTLSIDKLNDNIYNTKSMLSEITMIKTFNDAERG